MTEPGEVEESTEDAKKEAEAKQISTTTTVPATGAADTKVCRNSRAYHVKSACHRVILVRFASNQSHVQSPVRTLSTWDVGEPRLEYYY